MNLFLLFLAQNALSMPFISYGNFLSNEIQELGEYFDRLMRMQVSLVSAYKSGMNPLRQYPQTGELTTINLSSVSSSAWLIKLKKIWLFTVMTRFKLKSNELNSHLKLTIRFNLLCHLGNIIVNQVRFFLILYTLHTWQWFRCWTHAT